MGSKNYFSSKIWNDLYFYTDGEWSLITRTTCHKKITSSHCPNRESDPVILEGITIESPHLSHEIQTISGEIHQETTTGIIPCIIVLLSRYIQESLMIIVTDDKSTEDRDKILVSYSDQNQCQRSKGIKYNSIRQKPLLLWVRTRILELGFQQNKIPKI